MNRRQFLTTAVAGSAAAALGASLLPGGGYAAAAEAAAGNLSIRPGHPEWPRAWTSYRKVKSLEEDWADLKAHGVGLVNRGARNVEDARAALETARRLGMKYHIELGEVTETPAMISGAGLTPVEALMIGGVYQGRAVDRHLFTFTAARHEIVIEPPVYNKGLAYTRGSGGTGKAKSAEKIGRNGSVTCACGGWHGHAPLRDHVPRTAAGPSLQHGHATARDHATRRRKCRRT